MPKTINGKPIDEKVWNEAKSVAETKGKSDNFAFIVGIYKSMKGIKESINIMEGIPLHWEGKLDVKESEEKDGETYLNIGGVALQEGISKNRNIYSVEEYKDNNDKSISYFSEHRIVEEHLVGVGKLNMDGNKLRHSGQIKNTKMHPDIVENSANGWLAVSIDGGAKRVERIKESDGYSYKLYGVFVDNMAITPNPSVGGASIDFAISESFDAQDKGFSLKESEPNITKKQEGENTMPEDNSIELKEANVKIQETEVKVKESEMKLKEAQDEIDKLKDIAKKKVEDDLAKSVKNVKENIIKVNSKVTEEDLKDKSLVELKLIESYEIKIKESETEEVVGETDEEPDEKNDLKESIVEDKFGMTIKESTSNKLDDKIREIYE